MDLEVAGRLATVAIPFAIVLGAAFHGTRRRSLPILVCGLGLLGIGSVVVRSFTWDDTMYIATLPVLCLLPLLTLWLAWRLLRAPELRPMGRTTASIWHIVSFLIGAAGVCSAWRVFAGGIP